MLPADEYNRTLTDNVHPPQWTNPDPKERYNLVVVGAGTAGLVTTAVAAALGARVALIERHLMGGDCLNVGCVPSKGVIRAARAWADVRNAKDFGAHASGAIQFDFGEAMARMRRLRARISANDSVRRYREMGVDVFIGQGYFTEPDAIEVDGKRLQFSRAAICTGARAAAPRIPGLEEAGYLTNETIFTLTELPPRLAVIGAGPIGCEMAQAFARFGSQVVLFEALHGILPKEDRDAAEIVHGSLQRDGVRLLCCGKELTVGKLDSGKRLTVNSHGQPYDIIVDEIVVAVGRAPNVNGLGLEAAGVLYDTTRGVKANTRLQTTNPKIFAAGDICFPYQFTHTADALAQIVVQNALFPHPFGLGSASTDSLIIPWCTYTQPEIAHVGMYEAEARAKRIPVETYSFPMSEVDRAILDGEDQGFARVHVRKGTDRILGATIVAAHAGDLINEVGVLMRAGAGLGVITRTIHPYPTQAEVIKKVATQWRKTLLTDRKKKILRRWFSWTR